MTSQAELSLEERRRAKGSSRALLLIGLEAAGGLGKPGGLFKEKELKGIAEALLRQGDAKLQGASLGFLLAYKVWAWHLALDRATRTSIDQASWMEPYRESLLRLVEEKTFRHELVLFTIDHEVGSTAATRLIQHVGLSGVDRGP